MGNTSASILCHCVFSTKNRRQTIDPDLQPKLWAHMGGIARRHRMPALAIGGTDDHAHVLLALPANMPVAQAMQLLKTGSSKWLHENHKENFEWQSGYGAFTIGIAETTATIAYICGQKEHHRRMDFRQEFLAFLKKHKVSYDEDHLWG